MKRLFTYTFSMPVKLFANTPSPLTVCDIPQTQYPGQ